MAEESADSFVSGSESNGCSTEKAFEDKLSLPSTESGVSPEDGSVSSDLFHDSSVPRRNSTGKPSPKAAKEKIIPHYLRASTGSCHDLCKYGRKPAFEDEDRPWRKKTSKAQPSQQKVAVSVPLEEEMKATGEKETMSPLRSQDIVVTAILGEGKKAMELEKMTQNPSKVRMQMASPVRKQSPARAALSGKKMKNVVHKKAASTDRQKSPAITAPAGERKKAMLHMQMASPDRNPRPTMAALSGEKKKEMVHKQKASSSDRECRSSAMAVSSGEKKNATIKKLTSPVRTSISLKHKSEEHPKPIKREVLFPSKNVGASLNSKVDKSSSKRSPQSSLMKKLSSLRSLRSAEKPEKAEKVKTLKSSLDSLYERSKGRDNISSDKDRVVVAKAPAKKVQVHPIGSSSPSIMRKKAISSKVVLDQNSVQKAKMGSETEVIPEKTLHVVLTESASPLSESAADDKGVPPLPSSEDAETEGESDEEVDGEFDDSDSFDEDEDGHAYEEEVDEVGPDRKGLANSNGAKAVDGNARKAHRKGWVMSDSNDPTPVKVKFRRGRIVDLQSDSNANAPRRLRFRQRRAIDEKHSHHPSDSRNRSKKEVEGSGKGDGDPDNVKVVLRHQDAQGKKDEQGLFNNVIEETASKLVESRKSKVKALVGAFETVISLQDTKTSSQTVS